MITSSDSGNIAVIMLACRDYEATELALACHLCYLPEYAHLFFLQNCRGDYDSERTLIIAKRYENLFPGRITVVDRFQPDTPYFTIRKLLDSELLSGYDLVCKTDDDAFPISIDWLDRLLGTFRDGEKKYGEKIAYATPLINNNTWGFSEVIHTMGLMDEYLNYVAIDHYVGVNKLRQCPARIASAGEIVTGHNGTIWGYPHIARWLHERTTLEPDKYINATNGLTSVEVPSEDRYSIGCILFRPDLWKAIYDGGSSDERMMHYYVSQRKYKIVCARNVPFVHLAYYSQREENRDITRKALVLYSKRLRFPFPFISLRSRFEELESRLRWLESRGKNKNAFSKNLPRFFSKLSNNKILFGLIKWLRMLLR